MARAVVPLTEAQRDLAERYVPMALTLARPLKERIPDSWDEFESAALLGLVEAARAFDPVRGVKFATFARRRILGQLRDARDDRLRRTFDADARDDCLGWSVIEATPDPRPTAPERDEAEDAAEAMLRRVPPRHAMALRLIYLGEQTHAQAARQMGLGRTRITQLHRDALAMLRRAGDGRAV